MTTVEYVAYTASRNQIHGFTFNDRLEGKLSCCPSGDMNLITLNSLNFKVRVQKFYTISNTIRGYFKLFNCKIM